MQIWNLVLRRAEASDRGILKPTIYQERRLLTSEAKEVKHGVQILQLLEAVLSPLAVAVIHYQAHTKSQGPVHENTAPKSPHITPKTPLSYRPERGENKQKLIWASKMVQ